MLLKKLPTDRVTWIVLLLAFHTISDETTHNPGEYKRLEAHSDDKEVPVLLSNGI